MLFGAAWPITRIALLHGASPAWFAAGRAALSGAAAFVLVAALGRLRLPSRGDAGTVLAVGMLQIAGFFALAHEGAALVPAGRTAILANATTVWMPLLSVLILHERLPRRRGIAAAAGLAGVAVLVGPWAIDWTARAALLGHALLLGAALCFALAIVLVRRAPPLAPMLDLLPWCFGLGTLVLVPYAWLRAPSAAFGSTPAAWGALLLIGLVAGPVGTWCVLRASASLPSLVASIGFLGAPAVGLLLSAAWLGEPLTPPLLAGFALIMAGILIAAWPPRR